MINLSSLFSTISTAYSFVLERSMFVVQMATGGKQFAISNRCSNL